MSGGVNAAGGAVFGRMLCAWNSEQLTEIL
jgi:hypothetical protein